MSTNFIYVTVCERSFVMVMAYFQCVLWIVLISMSYTGKSSVEANRPYDTHLRYLEPNIRYYNYEERNFPLQTGVHRGNQRSIAVESEYQNVRESQRKNIDTNVDDRGPRYQNGSLRSIMNNVQKLKPNLEQRRGINESIPKEGDDSYKVVYPGSVLESRAAIGADMPEITEECKKFGICEFVPNYPEEHVERIIKRLGDSVSKFNVDELISKPEIEIRYGAGSPTDIELCDYKERIIYPRAAQTKNGNWHFILNGNGGNGQLQGFRVEICTNTGSCKTDVVNIPSTYTSKCKQKKILRRMTAIDNKFNEFEDNFVLPSCCSCVVSSNDEDY